MEKDEDLSFIDQLINSLTGTEDDDQELAKSIVDAGWGKGAYDRNVELRRPKEKPRVPVTASTEPVLEDQQPVDLDQQRLEELAYLGAFGGRGQYKQAYDEYAAGQQQYRDMLTEQQQAVTENQRRIAGMQQQALTEYQNQQRGREVLRQVNERSRQKARAEIADVEDSITNFKVDPNGAFPTLGGKIMAAISIAVGAFAQGLSKNQIPNTALRIITDAANRDIDAQKMQLAKQRTVLSSKNNLYGQLLAEHGNAEKAYNLSMNGALHFANMKIQQAMNSNKGMETQQRLAQLLQASTQAQKEFQLKYIKHSGGDYQQHFLNTLAIRNQKKTGDRGAGKAGPKSIEDVIPLVDGLIETSKMIEKEDAEGQRFLTGALNAVGLTTAAMETATDLQQEWLSGVTLSAQGIMKAFQGSKPSDADWKIFIGTFPSLLNSGRARGNRLKSITKWLSIQTQNGKNKLMPGDIERAKRGGAFGDIQAVTDEQLNEWKKLRPDIFGEPKQYQPRKSLEQLNITPSGTPGDTGGLF